MMERIGVFSLLLCGSVHMISSETLHVRQTEGNIAVLRCGRLTKGPVTWSRETNGQRVDILTTHNGETTKHIADPDRRYSSGANLVLSIFRVSQSDAGRYDCSGATVELTVTSETGSKSTNKPTAATEAVTSTTTSTTNCADTKATETATTTTTSTTNSTGMKTTTTSTTTEGSSRRTTQGSYDDLVLG
ncbi:hypothetical protein SRHO_G00099430 [Serrasalmus rhombeus]